MPNLQRQKAKPDRVASADNEVKALDLRSAGKTYRDIAQILGISVSAAHNLVSRGMDRLIAKCEEKAEMVRSMELDRLDKLQSAVWDAATTGDIQAIDRMLKIMESRAKYTGAYAAIKTDNTTRIVIDHIDAGLAGLPDDNNIQAY